MDQPSRVLAAPAVLALLLGLDELEQAAAPPG